MSKTVPSTTRKTVKVGTATVKVTEAGQGEPLLYLHGAFGYSGWPAFLDSLSRRFTVYAPLHPGFGDSQGIEHIDDLLDLTLFHLDLLDALGLERPHLVGHFFGAMIAAEIAAIAGHRVDRLVLASPAGLWIDDEPGVDYFATPANELRALLFHDPDSENARAELPEPETDDEIAVQKVERVMSLGTVAKFLWPIPDKGLKKRLNRIGCPTLVVVADNDRLVPPVYGDEFTNRIDGARLHTVADAGHMFPLERPAEFARLVADFLTGTRRS